MPAALQYSMRYLEGPSTLVRNDIRSSIDLMMMSIEKSGPGRGQRVAGGGHSIAV